MRPLNPDELGDLGEKEFAKLCVSGHMICNESGRDRTGWDFIVESPFPTSSFTPMDQRPQPPECRSQVKTVWAGQKNIKLRLSSAERLAKHGQLACIFVLTVNQDKTFESLYGIHIIDDVLSMILKEIRKCEQAGSTRINRTFVRYNFIKLGERIEVSGEHLRAFIETAAGPDPAAYSAMKNRQITELGSVGNRFFGTFTLKVDDERELMDIMLGVKKGKITAISVTETRFGISLPIDCGNRVGELQVKPKAQKGQVAVRNKATKESAIVNVDVIFPAKLPTATSLMKIRMYNDFMDFQIDENNTDINFTIGGKSDAHIKLGQHLTANKVQRILTSGKAIFELRLKGRRVLISSDAMIHQSNGGLESALHTHEILSRIKAIVDASGAEDIRLSAYEINANLEIIDFIYLLLTTPESIGTISAKFKAIEEFSGELMKTEGLLIGRMVFDNEAIAFAAVSRVDILNAETIQELRLTQFSLRQVSAIAPNDDAFSEFERDMKSETALNLVIRFGYLRKRESH